MSVTLGIFDLFAYIVPGSLQLLIVYFATSQSASYLLANISRAPGLVLFVGCVIASYLLGHALYAATERLIRWTPPVREWWRCHRDEAREAFATKAGTKVANRPFVDADPNVLLAAIEMHDREMGAEIGRFRASGLMLRNAVLPVAEAVILAFIGLAMGPHRLAAAIIGVLLLGVALAFLTHGRLLTMWAYTKTLQLAMWVPDIDEVLSGQPKPALVPASREQPKKPRA